MSHIPPLSIFILDDDLDFGNKLLYHLKSNAGYNVKLFTDSDECLQQLSQSPDVIIVDYHLDGNMKNDSNGLVVLDKIKGSDPDIHVIMLTQLKHYGIAAQTIAKGAEQCVIKDDDSLKNIEAIVEAINNERK